jgi:hypothetical protein
VRDVVYLSHRVQFADARPAEQSVVMRLREGSDPARDEVEVLSFLTRPATILLEVGGHTYRFHGEAGVHVYRAPLAVGSISVQVIRGSDVVAAVGSPFAVHRTPAVQDEGYHFVGSGRDGYSRRLLAAGVPDPAGLRPPRPGTPTGRRSRSSR